MGICIFSNNFDGNASKTVQSISHLDKWAVIFIEGTKKHIFKSASKLSKAAYDFTTAENDNELIAIVQNCHLFSYCKSGDIFHKDFFKRISSYDEIVPKIGGFYSDYSIRFSDKITTIGSAGSYDRDRFARMQFPPRGFTLSPGAFQQPIPLELTTQYIMNITTVCPIIHIAEPLIELNANFSNN